MGEDQLDKFIKKQVEQLKTPNDPDLLWQKIQAKQKAEEKSKQRFPLFWWWGGASLLIAAGLLFTYPWWNIHQQGYPDSTQTAAAAPVPQTDPTPSDVKSTVDQAAATDVRYSSASNTDEQSLNPQSNERTSTVFVTATPGTAADPTLQTANRPSTNANEGATTSDQVDRSTSLAEGDQKPGSIPLLAAAPTAIRTLENNTYSPTGTREVAAKEEQQAASTESPVDHPFDDPTILPASDLLPTLELKVVYDVRAIDRVWIEAETAKGLLSDDNSGTEKPWRFSNGLAFAYGKGLRTLSERATTPADYLQTREQAETPLDAVRINLDLMAQHQSGMYLKSGLEYEQINERFDAYIEWDSTEVEPNQILAITLAMDGTTTQTTGNAEVSTTYWTRQKIYNHYHSIDIPLLLGYSSTKKDRRLGWFVEGGASLNLWFQASGKILSTTNELLLLEDKPALIRAQTGLSLVGGLGLTYQVADQFSIWANPGIKYRLGSITSEENALDQTYVNLGFNVGMRYYW
jgi:hypothetical protein